MQYVVDEHKVQRWENVKVNKDSNLNDSIVSQRAVWLKSNGHCWLRIVSLSGGCCCSGCRETATGVPGPRKKVDGFVR